MAVFGFLWFAFFRISFHPHAFNLWIPISVLILLRNWKKSNERPVRKRGTQGTWSMGWGRSLSDSQIVSCSCLKSGYVTELTYSQWVQMITPKIKLHLAKWRPINLSSPGGKCSIGNRLLQVSCGISVLVVLESQPRKSSRRSELLLVTQEAGLKTSQRSLPTFLWLHQMANEQCRTVSCTLKCRICFRLRVFYLQVGFLANYNAWE